MTLLEAVRALYYSAIWHADRPVDEAKLWTDLRDAAGFEPGKSPKNVLGPNRMLCPNCSYSFPYGDRHACGGA